VIWHIFVSDYIHKNQIVIFAVVVTVAFFAYIVHLMFPPSKRVEILVDAYGNNHRIIPFIAKRIEKCLKNVIKFIEKQPKKDVIKNVIAGRDENALEKLQGEFLKPRTTRRLTDGIEKKGNYLNALIGGVSESFRIPRESVEELINTKVDVSQNISKGIVSSYDEVKGSIERLTGIKRPLGEREIKYWDYIEESINEKLEDIRKKEESLKFQIEWIKELDKRRESIPRLLEVIKETSTGKAVSKLSKLLLEEAKNEEDILWLIRFANSRKGIPIGELLGLKRAETANSSNNALEWYKKPINLNREKGFFRDFDDWRRNKALKTLWDKFISWNELRDKNEKLDFAQPIAIGLASGYSAALRRILKGICEHVQDIKKLHIILISEAPGGDEEVLRAELKADYPGLRCDIMPIDVIKEKEMERQINSIFVGIEGINKQGDIVHPRGGSDVIKKMKKYEADVYAFGESYKVLDLTEADIDYTKLSLSRSENIDYVVTDHGVHKREENKWKLEKVVEDKLLFSWDSVPGTDNEKLRRFLKDDFDIEWVESAEIHKSDDTTISISMNGKSAEIKMDEKKEKAILKIRDGRIHYLKIRTENDKLNIYKAKIVEEALKDNLGCCAQHWKNVLGI